MCVMEKWLKYVRVDECNSRCALGLFVLFTLPGVDFPPVLFLGAFVALGVEVVLPPGPDRLRTCFVCAMGCARVDGFCCFWSLCADARGRCVGVTIVNLSSKL